MMFIHLFSTIDNIIQDFYFNIKSARSTLVFRYWIHASSIFYSDFTLEK